MQKNANIRESKTLIYIFMQIKMFGFAKRMICLGKMETGRQTWGFPLGEEEGVVSEVTIKKWPAIFRSGNKGIWAISRGTRRARGLTGRGHHVVFGEPKGQKSKRKQ